MFDFCTKDNYIIYVFSRKYEVVSYSIMVIWLLSFQYHLEGPPFSSAFS